MFKIKCDSMLPEVICLDPHLKRLQEEGFKIEVCGGYLFIHHIPFLNSRCEIADGSLAMELTMSGTLTGKPKDHTALWIGSQPCDALGRKLFFVNCERHDKLGTNRNANYFLSCCLDKGPYANYYEKVTYYCKMISNPADKINHTACELIKERQSVNQYAVKTPLVYQDTNASRAGISGLSDVFAGLKTAIVGLGGTGSYLLDKLAKIPVEEIHVFDDDVLLNHNAFRAPGAVSLDTLDRGVSKVEYYKEVYSVMHSGIVAHNEKLTTQNASSLEGFDMVFICVDNKASRIEISDALIDLGVPFIDTGMGAQSVNGHILGVIRCTLYDGKHMEHLKKAFDSDGSSENIYSSNIQIAELNSIAADMAIIRWKQLLGYYCDAAFSINSLYSVEGNLITSSRYEPSE